MIFCNGVLKILQPNLRQQLLKQSQKGMERVKQLLENDTIRIMFVLTIQIFLSYPLKTLRKSRRYLFSTVLGTLTQWMVFGYQTWIILGFGIAMFVLTKKSGKRCGAVVTTVSMVFLSSYHLYDVIYKYGDYTMGGVVLLMVMVCKYSLFAFAYQDGHYQVKDERTDSKVEQKGQMVQEDKNKINGDKRGNDKNASKQQKKSYKIEQDVKLTQYIGYLQFLPTSVMGPPIEFKIYKDFIKTQGIFSIDLPSRKPIIIQTLKQLSGCGILYALSFIIFSPEYLKSEQFFQMHPILIFIYSTISLTLLRFKYYTAWKTGILSVHSSGISYNPTTCDFTAIDHCKVMIIETTPHIRQKIGNWNIMVQDWLKKCIYERVTFKSRFLRQLAVFMVSAFWHGFYSGYYFSFFLWFTQVYVQAEIYRLTKHEGSRLKKMFKKLGKFQIFGTIISCSLFSHNATFFYLLRSRLCIQLMQRLYFIPQLILPLSIIVFKVLAKVKKSKKSE